MLKPGISEHLVAATFEYHVKKAGAEQMAYVPVVASGINGLALHYVANADCLRFFMLLQQR